MSAVKADGKVHLRIEGDSKTWDFVVPASGFTIGRTAAATVVLPFNVLSSVHLEFVRLKNRKWAFCDKRTSNGTYVSGKKLEGAKYFEVTEPLNLRVGLTTELKIVLEEVENPEDTAVGVPNPPENPQMEFQQAESAFKEQSDIWTRQIEGLKADYEAARKHLELMAAQIANTKTVMQAHQMQKHSSGEALESLRVEVRVAEEKLKQIQAECDQKNLDLDKTTVQKSEELTKLVVQKMEELKQAGIELDKVSAKEVELGRSIATKEVELARTIANKEADMQRTILAKEAELQRSIASKEAELQRTISDKSQTIHRLESEVESWNNKSAEAKEKSEKFQNLFIEASRQLDGINAQITSVRPVLEAVDLQKRSSEAALESVRVEIRSAEGKLKRMMDDCVQQNETLDRIISEEEDHVKTISDKKFEIEQLASTAESLKVSTLEADVIYQDKVKALEAKLEEMRRTEEATLQSTYKQKAEQQSHILAEKKHAELIALEKETEIWRKSREEKRPFEIKEIIRANTELFAAHTAAFLEPGEEMESVRARFLKDVESIVESVLKTGQAATDSHLKAALAQSPEIAIRRQRRIRRTMITAGSIVAVIAVLIIFPAIPKGVVNVAHEMMNPKPPGVDPFIEKMRLAQATRPRFLPEQEFKYRESIADNVLYAKGYAEMKNDDDLKKEWTLKLNKFFLEQLELDEKAIVLYMTMEAPLIKELSQMSSKLRPDTKDVDIARMKDLEAQHRDRMILAVKGEQNYKRLRDFESAFYKERSGRWISSLPTPPPADK